MRERHFASVVRKGLAITNKTSHHGEFLSSSFRVENTKKLITDKMSN